MITVNMAEIRMAIIFPAVFMLKVTGTTGQFSTGVNMGDSPGHAHKVYWPRQSEVLRKFGASLMLNDAQQILIQICHS